MLQRLAVGQVAGHFQVQGQRGQLVAQQVMQLARDARALIDPGALGQQGAGGTQFRVEPALFVAGLGLATGHQCDHEHEAGEAHVAHRLQHGDERREAQRLDVDRQHRQVAGHQPDHADARPQQPWQQAGHHHQQDASQRGTGKIAHADRAGGQQDQRRRQQDVARDRVVEPGVLAVDQADGVVDAGNQVAQQQCRHEGVEALPQPLLARGGPEHGAEGRSKACRRSG
ncbi:hypothetical protein G6F63_014078 [Rhizopus arrhizus]|nr:hypothetical protein G6F63_014078 [Rhizopus arrhizus]